MFFQVALIKLLSLFYFTDKRNSTGNLYFEGGNSQDPGGLSTISNSLQQGSARILRGLSGSQPVGVRDSNSSLSSMNSDYDPNDPQAMFSRELRTAAGKLTSFFCKKKNVVVIVLCHFDGFYKGNVKQHIQILG